MPPRSSLHWKLVPASPVNDHDGESAEPGVGGAEVIDGVDGAAVSST